ncbi:coniferyl-alcohol dehydrogenase [Sphingomonas solaris]|uniref:SDR family oxidoreductase n=1 Tax=Alterirhizorhabdus solaris TaxID=2529389 RepID=A0A558RA35_9SPHN|nr:coniferyl-alcohol dehydrogenase [Sphingomonas solaris]TVV76253.1 SDR family oxidoreductase [Sphingomonas solaris]
MPHFHFVSPGLTADGTRPNFDRWDGIAGMTEFYRGKRVVVTGCASGIGAQTARVLAAQGAHVIGLDQRRGEEATAGFFEVDLGDPVAVDAVAEAIGGRVDVLFNCAGMAPTQAKMAILKVNYLGTRHLAERIAALMGAGGAIVSVSSNGGLRWRTRRATLLDLVAQASFADGMSWLKRHEGEIVNGYAFAKEALTVWTLHESARFIKRGIRLNCTSPGAVQTPMLSEIEEKIPAAAIDGATDPIGRRSEAEEQVGPLLFLGSDAASYVNGVDLSVDGGYSAIVALRE